MDGSTLTLPSEQTENLAGRGQRLIARILDYISIFFGSRKRLGDMIVGTKVLRADGPQVG